MKKNKTVKNKQNKFRPLAPGHTACAGCGQMIAARTVAEALGPNVIIANATGCLEVTTTRYPESSWGMPWVHSLFENAAAVASGIKAALDYKERKNPPYPPLYKGGTALSPLYKGDERGFKSPLPPFNKGGTKVVAQGGDGGTFDIGLGLISGMWERGDDIIYICYDTEAYSNTGIQASGATPFGANTTTTPIGECKEKTAPLFCKLTGSDQRKKDMIAIALAHGLNYVAQTTAGFVDDIAAKVKKAMAVKGPSYIQILTPCVPGWNINPAHAVKLGKLAAQTGLYPLLEYENGRLTKAGKISRPQIKVDEYLKLQGRFAHLFKNGPDKSQIARIQEMADENIRKYGL